MPLSLAELKDRAIRFAQEWQTAADERADAQAFWIDFFHVFDVKRRRVASFEVPIKKADGRQGFIDLLWKGTLLVEHKSRGRDLDRAFRAFLEEHTRPDGTDVGTPLAEWFSIMDQPPGQRQRHLAPALAQLPHVNGSLFTKFLRPPPGGGSPPAPGPEIAGRTPDFDPR